MISSALVTLAALTAGPPVLQEWPELRGPNQDGAARDVAIFSQPFHLRLAWRRDLGAGYSGVVAVEGRVVGTFSDGTDDQVVALDVSTGDVLWSVRLGPMFPGTQGAEDGPSSTPCIAGGRVFATGPRGRLVAVDLEEGRELWSVDLVERFGARITTYGFGASRMPVGDVVYVPVGTSNGIAGAAFDPETGEVRWEHRGGSVGYQNSVRFAENISSQTFTCASMDPPMSRNSSTFTTFLRSARMRMSSMPPL